VGEMLMNILSLFDGISCGRVALDKANIDVYNYYASEIDENAIKIAQYNYPNTIQLGDITKINCEQLKGLPKIDLILAGSPCQGFSRAGKCLNFDDPRSKLFFNFVSILNWIKEYNNPNVKFLLENVKMKNEWKDVITDFVKVKPIEINSKLITAQNRPRVYWTNIEGVKQPEDRNINLIDILGKNVEIEYVDYKGLKIDKTISENSMKLIDIVNGEIRIKQSTKKGYIVAENGDGLNLSFPTSKSRRGRVIKKKSSTLDCACNLCVLIDGCIRRYTLTEMERLQTLQDGYTKVEGISAATRKKVIGNGWTADVIAHILRGIL